ncbi:MAG: sulfite exporter TauE/SafE family protein [Bacteroidota bacterium]
MDWSNEVLLISGGVLAGVVNTVSGSGTLFSMGVMSLTGIPLSVANIATRPGVFFQNISGILVLSRYRQFSIKNMSWRLVISTGIGAMLGAVCAGLISGRSFNVVASLVMLLLLIQYLFPKAFKKWNNSFSQRTALPNPLLFFFAGFYGGFIQIGIGILILTLVLKQLSMSFAEANAYKLVIILFYTVPTTIYFASINAILWKPALIVAIGQVIGAALAAVFLSVSTKAKIWATWITVVMILVTLGKIWLFDQMA